ncbi:RNA polymerase sigma-70 factor [Streptomyces sp. RY43-2]|uniref:RNA polymerase sigma-70 factor n=1 Tax=Streptomyces macrolidinus TaxID=2952607 RepID=A0ABT0ZMK6_9ACTN|nr:RNA polymerase sigma-70 factor [Streptomyces macrolidinus]MCN9244820.1 RNA polymerase sigma-70 factor [Streptomyces macrolidinus]
MRADAVEEFERHRSRLFGLAYRMLGSAAEAEDVVQDTFLRWHRVQNSTVESVSGWLAKVATNLCLNRLTSARARREQYVGTWLPEPVLTADGVLGLLDSVQQRDSVRLAFLVLLERLNPVERAVFVLREAFDYSHQEVAEIVGLSTANSRQVHHRARRKVSGASGDVGPRPREQRSDLVRGFLAAAGDGDLKELERLLAEDVTVWVDGGGQVGAARRPIVGHARVLRYFTGIMGRVPEGAKLAAAKVNGEPGVLVFAGTDLIGVLVPEVVDGRITRICIIANPDKLAFSARLSHQAGLPGS